MLLLWTIFMRFWIFFLFFSGACSSFFYHVLISFKAVLFPLSFLCSCDIFPFEFNCTLQIGSCMSVLLCFILNLKLFLDLAAQLRLSSVLKSLNILTWLLPGITDVLMWCLQKTWMTLGNQTAGEELISGILALKSRAAELIWWLENPLLLNGV